MRKILSIDGGGIKGVFPAAFLATLEGQLRHPIGSYFDLIVGTSAGGIIAIGLGAGLRANEILSFYEEKGPAIFAGPRFAGWLRSCFGGKYGSASLRSALTEIFNDNLMGHSSTRLVIPSQNLETGEVHIFKTSHHPRFVVDYKVSMVDVAMATAAAPTFFPTHKLPSGTPLIDGGIWANNPAGVAAVEAIGVLGWKQAETLMLSLSCTSSPLTTTLAQSYSLGKIYWGAKLLEILGAGQSSSAIGMAKHLLGNGSVHRIDPIVAPGRFALDRHLEIASLKGLGASEARKALPNLGMFFGEQAEHFVPFHKV